MELVCENSSKVCEFSRKVGNAQPPPRQLSEVLSFAPLAPLASLSISIMPPIKNTPRKLKLGKRPCAGCDSDGDQCTTDTIRILCFKHRNQLSDWSDAIQTAVFKLHVIKCKPEAWENVCKLVSRGILAQRATEDAKGIAELETAVAALEAAIPEPVRLKLGVYLCFFRTFFLLLFASFCFFADTESLDTCRSR